MTICNMSIEAGARAGLIAPDQTTFDYIKGRPYAPKEENWDKAVEFWKSLPSDENANYAGFDWREPGCSMCLAMNPDQLKPKERCASTSNRNFEGRQGREGRTHLVSPVVAAASAIKGTFAQESDL